MTSEELHSFIHAGSVFRDQGLLNVRDDGVLLRLLDASGTVVYSSFIPSDAMEEFETGEYSRYGLRMNKIENFIPNNTDDVVVETSLDAASNSFRINDGNRKYDVPMVNPDSVNGAAGAESVPDLEHCISITHNFGFIDSFIKDFKSLIDDVKSGALWISARDEGIYLWANKDNSEIKDLYEWDYFSDHSINWDVGNSKESPHNPPEDHVAECILNTGFIYSMAIDVDEVEIHLDNAYPMKTVAKWESGMMQSWIIPPLIPDVDKNFKVPERVFEQY